MNESVTQAQAEVVRVRILPDGRLSRGDAARYLGLKSKTLSMWSMQGRGPRPIKVGGRVFYYRHSLDRFICGEVEPGPDSDSAPLSPGV